MAKIDFAQQVPIPADGSINGGVSPCGSALLNHFGKPGKLSLNCSPVTNAVLQKKIVTADVGPFSVTGLKPAVASLKRVFDKVQAKDPALFEAMKSAGMLCCRLIRGSRHNYSIHSWGGAIDLCCGNDGVVPLGTPATHLGVMRLYPFLHNEGFYWGAEFARNDAMHFECSKELIQDWIRKGWI